VGRRAQLRRVVACRYDDGRGKPEKDFTRTVVGFRRGTYCRGHRVPATVGRDGDTFGRVSTFQNGELLTARWVDGSVATPTVLDPLT
jgi:hypothetical protein